MRILYLSPRYGPEVAGGAEANARDTASRLAQRGHEVTVVTSCATSYVDWANVLAPGHEVVDGVHVHRLPVARERDDRRFAALNSRVAWGQRPVPIHLQREWMRLQGPELVGLDTVLSDLAREIDVALAIPYLYATTHDGLAALDGNVPVVLQPAAHDEPPLYLPLFDRLFRLPAAIATSTEEEKSLVQRRFGGRLPVTVVGVGVELDSPDVDAATVDLLPYGFGDKPYLLCVGRVDPAKGSAELFDYFVALKNRTGRPLQLVFLGDAVRPLPSHDDVICTGFVSTAVRDAAISRAAAVVVPSYFESFSLVLCEAWLHERPALVQGRCEVLRGQAERSGGGLPYAGFTSFETAVHLLLDEPEAATALGGAGRRFVEESYRWSDVLDRLETVLESAT